MDYNAYFFFSCFSYMAIHSFTVFFETNSEIKSNGISSGFVNRIQPIDQTTLNKIKCYNITDDSIKKACESACF